MTVYRWHWSRAVRAYGTDGEEDYEVLYIIHPGQAAKTYGPPERCQEGFPAEIEILEILPESGRRLTDDEVVDLAAECLDANEDAMFEAATH